MEELELTALGKQLTNLHGIVYEKQNVHFTQP